MNAALIIPTVDRLPLLRRAVASAHAQERPFAEIVVVNDGPNELTPEDLPKTQNHQDPLVRVVKTSMYEGLPAARAKGLSSFQHPYIDAVCYLDDDDELLPNHVSSLLPVLESGQPFAFSKALFKYANGMETEDPEPGNTGAKRYYDCFALMNQNIAPVSSFMHALYASREIGGWDKSLIRLEDWDFWARMSIRFGAPIFVPRVTNIIHKGTPGNLTDSSMFSYSMACSWRDIVSDRLRAMFDEQRFRVTKRDLERFHIPKVGVVMPFYNAEKYMREAIESLLAQTYRDFEVIGVNDGSTDNSKKIFASYGDTRLRIFDLHENSGVVKALNSGLLYSRSEYIARMDADDVAMPERFEKQVSFLDKNKDVMVVGTNFLSMDENLEKCIWENVLPQDPDAVRQALLKSCCIGHPTVMMRRRVVEICGGYGDSPELKHVEDYELWLRIAKRFKIANIGEHLLKYRQHPNQVSQRFLEVQRERSKNIADKYASPQ